MEVTAGKDPGWQEITPKYNQFLAGRNLCFRTSWRRCSLLSPGGLSQATPGSEWTVTPKPQGLVRNMQDSGLVGWERSVSPNAEQPFVIAVTREAGEWNGGESELSPPGLPCLAKAGLRRARWARSRKPVPHLSPYCPEPEYPRTPSTVSIFSPASTCAQMHVLVWGALKVLDLAEGKARSWHHWLTEWFNTPHL